MIKSIIFDIGNVLLPFDFSVAVRRLQLKCRNPITDGVALTHPLVQIYESGAIGRDEFVTRIKSLLEFSGTDSELVEIWQDIFTENTQMTGLVRSLQGRYPLYLLSNTSDIHFDFFSARYPVFQLFSDAVYSYRVSCMKPGRGIFEKAIRQFGVEPAQTVYIDDVAANVQGARDVGLVALQYDFNRHSDFLEELKSAGVDC